ncbi:hypothetical protein BDB01DRAFT_772999 [Pilobolus umbonatus]|nr:hypothetical protein BDB01DRAFT_772999 [Pilobolus umbonatus]
MKISPRFILILLTCLQLSGIYIFLKGFLLTRQTINRRGRQYSSWERFPIEQPLQNTTYPTIPSNTPFKRTLIVVIDALRFDFLLNISDPTEVYYHNKLPIIQELYHTQPQSSLLFQFRADPPTTTMQRIKGLMTGSLPTFIDAGSNFASSAVGEDNILHHIKNRYPNLYMLGDDTWVHLFPEIFDHPERTFASDSFKMMDLDSVDDDILSHLWPLIEDSDWQMMVAHFLGVDHCGHTHGPSHPNMERKLRQMNQIIERLVPHINNDTLLVVMGDHGMTTDGDHGGESVEELMSSLFLYSGRPLTLSHAGVDGDYYDQLFRRIHHERYIELGYDLSSISDRLSYDASEYTIAAQIHLVPTLAYLLQVPIPFGNLGAILPNLLYPRSTNRDNSRIQNLIHIVEQFRVNALQVYDYITEYSRQTQKMDFSPHRIKWITEHLYQADNIMHALWTHPLFIQQFDPSIELSDKDIHHFQLQLEKAILEYDAFLINIIKYCKAIWAQFDVGSMCIGILLMGLSTASSVWMIKRQIHIQTRTIVMGGGAYLLLIMACIYSGQSILRDYIHMNGWFEKMGTFDWILTAVAISICLLSFTSRSIGSAFKDWYLIIAVLIQSLTLGSNSFVIWEDRGSRFILITLCTFWSMRRIRAISHYSTTAVGHAVFSPLLFMAVVRFIGLTGVCREEQFPDCSYLHSSLLSFDTPKDSVHVAILIILVLFMVTYNSSFTRKKTDPLVTLLYQICGLIAIIRMIEDIYLNSHSVSLGLDPIAVKLSLKILDVYLPRLLYVLCATGSIYSTFKWEENSKYRSQMGWSYLLLWSTMLAILQRPFASVIIMASPWIANLLIEPDSSDLIIRLTILQVYGHYLFFVTGHQVTFTALPWKAAFVGFDEMSYYGGMILVTLSTLAGYIVSWIGWLIILSDIHKEEETHSPLQLMTLLQSIPTLCCAIFIFILRRHLMTWKIFAPRFLFQVLLQVGSHAVAILFEGMIDG